MKEILFILRNLSDSNDYIFKNNKRYKYYKISAQLHNLYKYLLYCKIGNPNITYASYIT